LLLDIKAKFRQKGASFNLQALVERPVDLDPCGDTAHLVPGQVTVCSHSDPANPDIG